MENSPIAPLPTARPRHEPSFNLLRWFSLLSFVAIVAVIGGSTWLVTQYLTQNLLLRDAVVSRDFLEDVLTQDVGAEFFRKPKNQRDVTRLNGFVRHLSSLTGLVAATILGPDGAVVWSSANQGAASLLETSDSLQRALRGYVVIQWGRDVAEDHRHFRESGVDVDINNLVNMYLPIRGAHADDIFAVVKLSSTPHALFDTISEQVWFIQLSALIGGVSLYAAFFGIVYRADRTLQRQQELLREGQAMATIGEMSAAVAHNIRNPLAAIRAAAELTRECGVDDVKESCDDIIHEADRINGWVSDLLMVARENTQFTEMVDLNEVIAAVLKGKAAKAAQRNIKVTFNSAPLPPVPGCPALLSHAVLNVIANAYDAMPGGGTLKIETRAGYDGVIKIIFEDSGAGIPEHLVAKIFQPMFTTKPNGTGLGLALTKRIVEKHSGQIAVQGRPERGARVEFSFPVKG